jgi:integrase
MPAKRKKEEVARQFFRWLVWQRNGLYYADGRSGNRVNAGRHSLGTDDRAAALEALTRLDLVQAVTHGLADPKLLGDQTAPLPLSEGRRLYEENVGRHRVVGGVRPATSKRYRAVLDKFLPFAEGRGVRTWNRVDVDLVQAYAAHLAVAKFADGTIRFELNQIKTVVKCLIRLEHLTGVKPLVLKVEKPDGTTTYCWTPEQVRAMLDHCRARPDLAWLQAVLVGLSCTGLRISELASLRWSDVDWDANVIRLTDEGGVTRHRRGPGRQTKSGRGRSFPINPSLAAVLKAMKKSTDGLIYHGPLGGRLKPDTVRAIFVREVLGPLEARFATPPGETGFADGRLHSFRHYFCSRCAAEGIPERVVMWWLGHQDSKMISHYFHLFDSEAQRHMKRLDLVGGEPGGVAGQCGNGDG